jgi:two-component sensor histidine kinase/CHASE1-domain containing sensor protein
MVTRLAVLAFAVVSLLGAAITWAVHSAEAANRQARLDGHLAEAARLVASRIDQHLALLTASRAFLETAPDPLDRVAFAEFVRGLGLRGAFSGLQGIGFSRIVTPEAEGTVRAYLATAQEGARIWPDEGAPGLRTAIVLLEPGDERNRAAIGFDMASEERRHAAMERARATGAAAATAPVTLVQEITAERQAGFLIYLPSRLAGGIEGFTYAPVRAGDLFAASLEGSGLPVSLRAWDVEAPEPALYETPGHADAAAGALSSWATLTVAGREWAVAAVPLPAFDAGRGPGYTPFSAMIFALLALATGFAVYWQGTAIARARALGEAQRRSAAQKDLLLQEMAHRMKNALARVMAIARQAERESGSKEEMAETLAARLRAMAGAQDLLVRSGLDSADLGDLLRSEIQQIHGGETGLATLDGPPVKLDARRTHALALVFHELATNALKYGAGSQPGGELRIGWDIRPGPELRLVWEERVPGAAPVAGSGPGGFGSRMLDMLVRGELGGRLDRHLRDRGLTVEMAIPLA